VVEGMILKAETIWCRRGRIIRNGAIRIHDGTIAEIAPVEEMAVGDERVQDLGDAILLPALINAHTHLDLSLLKGKTEKGSRFVQWLRTVGKARAMMFFEGRSIRKGISETIAGGAGAVGDVSVSGKSAAILRRRGLYESVVFCEALGLDPADAGRKADELRSKIETLRERTPMHVGISPHSTYTVSPELFRRCASLAEELGLPVAIYVAESESEVQFLMSGQGELRELLEAFDMIPEKWRPPRKRPIHYLDDLGALRRRPLLIHCYQVDAAEADVIASRGCSVAYCPRSNAFFRRPADSLRLLLDAGINVALGTDSLASNDSLSMLDEMRFLKQRHPELGWETILEMGTINAARALGIECGILGEGRPADLTAIKPSAGDDPKFGILGEGASVVLAMVAGRRLFKGRKLRG